MRAIDANLTRNTEVFGKMDPYIKMQVGDGEVQSTTVKENAGIHPKWDESFRFQISNPMLSLKLSVMDKDVSADDCIG